MFATRTHSLLVAFANSDRSERGDVAHGHTLWHGRDLRPDVIAALSACPAVGGAGAGAGAGVGVGVGVGVGAGVGAGPGISSN